MNQALLESIKELVLALLTGQGVELVDLLISRERGKSCLRFLVTKTGGITLDECARLNQKIGQMLDQENIIQESYVLEVSSPGLDRPLVNTRDFQRCLGKLVKIVLHQALGGQNVLVGSVEDINEQNVVIQTEEQQRLCVLRRNIARANLEVRFG